MRNIDITLAQGMSALSFSDLDRAFNQMVEMSEECLHTDGDACESVIELRDSVEFFYTAAMKNGQVQACVRPRDLAEKILNRHRVSTHELFELVLASKGFESLATSARSMSDDQQMASVRRSRVNR